MNETDSQVIALQAKVAEKKKKIGRAERPTWNGNCVIPLPSGPRNLQTVSSVAECVSLFAEISAKAAAFEAANAALNTKEKFSFGGLTLQEWREDFATRISMISIVKEKQKLRELETALESLESSELKRKKTLDSIQKALED